MVLDIRGSFIATTAERFVFNNGTQFSATNPQLPLLTMSVPVGLQYGTGRGTITNQGNLAAGQDLILSATNLTLSGQLYAGRDLKLQAQDTVQVRDSVTNPFIAPTPETIWIFKEITVSISLLSIILIQIFKVVEILV